MFLEEYLIDLNDYEEEQIIGEGNFSIVSLVHKKNNNKIKFAMKKISIDLTDKDSQKYFIRELIIMTELEHQCLIKLTGFSLPSKNDQTFRILSEYAPNKTLLEILKMQEDEAIEILNPTQKSKIIYGIASAMKYLHMKNIVHRDLKPDNIFLNSEFEPILSDFGLSKICNEELTMTSRIGTPYYMAPELFKEDGDDDNKITNKIDVYSFGVTLFSLFSTKFHFSGGQPRTINQLMKFITGGKRYKIPQNMTEFYENLINRCWSNDADERPSFEEILELFESNDDFILEKANAKEVKEYMRMLKDPTYFNEKRKSNNYLSSSSSSEDECEEEDDTCEFIF